MYHARLVFKTHCISCNRRIYGVRPGGQRNHHRYGYRSGRSRCRRGGRGSQEHGNRSGLSSRIQQRRGSITITDLPVGTYAVSATVHGVQDLHPLEPRRRGDAGPQGRHPSASRRHLGVRERHGRSYAAEDRNRRVGPQRHAGRKWTIFLCWASGPSTPAPPAIRNPFNTMLTLPGVSGYSSSGLFTLNGLGGAAAYRDDAHRRPGRDLAHLRDLRLYADGPAQRGRDSGNRVPDQQLLRRIRAGGHRGDQHDHEVRHQPISRQRLRLLCQRRPECRRSLTA